MSKHPGTWRLLGGFVILGTLVIVAATLPAHGWALAIAAWIRTAGLTGVSVFVAVYVTGAVLLLPGSLLTLIAGFAYGPVFGTLVAWTSATLAATLAFLVGRFIARGWVQRRIEAHPRFAAVDRAVGREGFKIVLLLRLSPIFPFNLLNYGLSLTGIPLSHYVVASLLGMLPGAALFAYLGSLVTTAAALADGPPDGGPVQWLLYVIGFLSTIAATALITRVARRELRRSLQPDPASTTR